MTTPRVRVILGRQDPLVRSADARDRRAGSWVPRAEPVSAGLRHRGTSSARRCPVRAPHTLPAAACPTPAGRGTLDPGQRVRRRGVCIPRHRPRSHEPRHLSAKPPRRFVPHRPATPAGRRRRPPRPTNRALRGLGAADRRQATCLYPAPGLAPLPPPDRLVAHHRRVRGLLALLGVLDGAVRRDARRAGHSPTSPGDGSLAWVGERRAGAAPLGSWRASIHAFEEVRHRARVRGVSPCRWRSPDILRTEISSAQLEVDELVGVFRCPLGEHPGWRKCRHGPRIRDRRTRFGLMRGSPAR